MYRLIIFFSLCISSYKLFAQLPTPLKPRILISTDIGCSDPDDNQSMIHLLMYSDKFNIEGLVSSPGTGKGRKEEIFRMIDLYEKDFPKLEKHQKELASPNYLRSITKQGDFGKNTFEGYSTSTEGSNWIVQCAKKKSDQPLWILVWGGLRDLAQALHDAPEIQKNIKVYWIGGPNKKGSSNSNSYAYIAENFPNLWFIENNASYYGFFTDKKSTDSIKTTNYYDNYIQAAGEMGKDFKNYYNGVVKMGDSPSLFYMMDGDPNNPTRESWGGSFEKINHSSHRIFNRVTNISDTVAFCTVIEFHLKGPIIDKPKGTSCFWLETKYKDEIQKFSGFYLGNGEYAIRYTPKQAEIFNYKITSDIKDFPTQEGQIVVTNLWPGDYNVSDYKLGENWYSDKTDAKLYDGKLQGGKTIAKWRSQILLDWAKRWEWLK
jgi:hypothetical protein